MSTEFNEAQLEAIHTIRGPVMVISCAGSGKTTVILERTAGILKETRQPSRILVGTFSRAAAAELANRFQAEYGVCGVRFTTIHSICYSVLASTYGLTAESILKEKERRDFFRTLQERLLAAGETVTEDFEEFYQEISEELGRGNPAEDRRNPAEGRKALTVDSGKGLLKQIREAYTGFKKQNHKVDFDDMILLCFRCLKGNPQVLSYWQSVFDYIMIDEYQDTSPIQAEIFFLLAEKHGNLCVVGDDDQSIYGFRGADSGIFLKFQQKYPECRRIFMTVNYRSLPQIIRRSAALIAHNSARFDKEFQAARKAEHRAGEDQSAIRIIRCGSELKQVEAVLKGLDEGRKRGLQFKEMAVLYRVKREAAPLVNRLLLEGIPFYIRELPQDIHKGLVYQDIMAYYRLANGMEEQGDLFRIWNRPKRYLKNQLIRGCALDRLALYRACTRDACTPHEYDRINDTVNQLFLDLRNLRGLSPSCFLEYLNRDMGYLDSVKEYAEYRKLSSEEMERDYAALAVEAGSFPDMCTWAAFVEETGNKGFTADKEGVYLTTFHGAKGLEWKSVFILSADEKITPYQKKDGWQDLEEERRLFYVAMTRARDELHILTSSGKGQSRRKMSRFVEELL